MKHKLITLLIALICTCDGSSAQRRRVTPDSRWFSVRRGHTLWSTSLFKLTRATPDECAARCLSMRGRCLSFDFNKRTHACFGRSQGTEAFDERARVHTRPNRNYDFYGTTRDRVRQVLSGGEPGGVENRARIVIPTIQRPRATVHPTRQQSTRTKLVRSTTTTPLTIKRHPSTTIREQQHIILSGQECRRAIGIENGQIRDSAFSATSQQSGRYAPEKARLNGASAWMTKIKDGEQYLQIDLDPHMRITAIGTQGFVGGFPFYLHNYATSFKIQYKKQRNGGFRTYREVVGKDKVFAGLPSQRVGDTGDAGNTPNQTPKVFA